MVHFAPVYRRLLVGSAAFITSVIAAGQAQSQSLSSALVQLYNASPDLMAARYVAENTNEIYNQVAANALPIVTASSQGQYARSYTELLRDQGDFNTSGSLTTGISVSQQISPVISGGVVQTKKSIEAGWVNYDLSEQQIILNGINAYLGVIRAQQTASLQSGNITLLQNQLEGAQARFDAGTGTRTDIAQVAASLADARASLTQASGNVAIAKATYAQVFGVNSGNLIFPPLPAKMPRTLNEARAAALTSSPSVRAALVALEEAEAKKKVTEAELKPGYSLGLNAQRQQDILGGGGTTSFSTSFGVSMPVYGSRQVSKSKVRQDDIAIRRLREQLASTQAQVEQQVIQAWNQYVTAQSVGSARSSQISAAELQLRGAEAELDAGTKTTTDVISAKNSLTNAQVQAASARIDVVSGAYSLMFAIGGLSAQDLGLPVRYYVPENEFENRKIRNLATLIYDRQ